VKEPWANVDLRSTWPTIVYIHFCHSLQWAKWEGYKGTVGQCRPAVDLAYDSLHSFLP
jgi:hypothetical protein